MQTFAVIVLLSFYPHFNKKVIIEKKNKKRSVLLIVKFLRGLEVCQKELLNVHIFMTRKCSVAADYQNLSLCIEYREL